MWVSKIRGIVGDIYFFDNPWWANDKNLFSFNFRLLTEHSKAVHGWGYSKYTYVPKVTEIAVVGYAKGTMADTIRHLKKGDEIQVEGETFQMQMRNPYVPDDGLQGFVRKLTPRKTLPYIKVKPTPDTFKILKKNEK